MIDVLATAVIVCALLLAVWSLISAVRNRATDLSHLIGAAVVEVLVLIQAVAALLPVAEGGGPTGALATFMGYLLVAVLLVPAGLVLARMEPTRWGSVILLVACLVLPVLVVRLQQIWENSGG